MEFKKQQSTLPVTNFDTILPKISVENKHGPLFPNCLRSLFVGSSGSGKTNSLLSIILANNGLRFENIYLYSKSLNQPKYIFLADVLKQLDNINFFTFHEHEHVISPDEIKPYSLMIFDDIQSEKQDHVRAFFSRGRHVLSDSFYLCQTYSKIPKQLIRDNANFLVIFKQDETNLKHIYNDHVNTDMTYNKFKELCLRFWDDKHGFLVINKECDLNCGRYRKAFDTFININD